MARKKMPSWLKEVRLPSASSMRLSAADTPTPARPEVRPVKTEVRPVRKEGMKLPEEGSAMVTVPSTESAAVVSSSMTEPSVGPSVTAELTTQRAEKARIKAISATINFFINKILS